MNLDRVGFHLHCRWAIIGDMDCVYSSWTTDAPEGFAEQDVADLCRLTPFLALAVKSASLARIAATLVETYLGRDAGRRVLQGRIVRGVAERIEAVLWFSDLHKTRPINAKWKKIQNPTVGSQLFGI